jgi:hypothetical protein
MTEIVIRETIEPNKLFYIDLNGNTVWAENNKEELKNFVSNLIDDIYAAKED